MSTVAESQESNDKLFAIVAKELSIGKKDDALWTKAFALENGDANRSNAHYIRLRVEKLRQFGSNAEAATEGENSSDTAEGVPEPSARQAHSRAQGGKVAMSLRWGIGLLATIVLIAIYGIWKEVERHVGGGFLTGLLRGAIVFGGLAGIWRWVMGREKIHSQKKPRPTGDKENLMPLYVLTAVIAVGMVFFLVSQQKPRVSQEPPAPVTAQQGGMFDDLYQKSEATPRQSQTKESNQTLTPTQATDQNDVARFWREIDAAIPDFELINNDPRWFKYLDTRIPGKNLSYREMANWAVETNNSAALIEIVRRWKQETATAPAQAARSTSTNGTQRPSNSRAMTANEATQYQELMSGRYSTDRTKCTAKPVMTDEELARCK